MNQKQRKPILNYLLLLSLSLLFTACGNDSGTASAPSASDRLLISAVNQA